MRHGLSDVVQQRSTGRAARVGAQLRREHRGEPRALDRVMQDVLPVARAELQPAEQLHELRVERADVRLEDGLLPHLDHVLVDLRLRLVERLLDPGRMDPTVLKQALERESRDLAAHSVEAGQEHRSGRVVDDEVDPGERLERADVAPLPADDAALQLVGLELDDRDRGLHSMARRHPLHHRGENAARAPVGVAAGLLLDLPNHTGAVVAQVVLELVHQDLLRLPRAQPRHPLELAELARLLRLQLLADVVEVASPVLERALALAELLRLELERALLRAEPLLQPRDLGTTGEQLLFEPIVPDRDHLAGFRHSRRHRGRLRPRLRGHGSRANGARALHEHHHRHRDPRRDQRRQHDLHLRLLTRRTGRRSQLRFVERCGMGPRDCRRLETLPRTPFGTVTGGCQDHVQVKHQNEAICSSFRLAPGTPTALT
jgi:hypothetical protein